MSQFMGVMTDPFMNRPRRRPSAAAGRDAAMPTKRAPTPRRKTTDAFAMFTKAPPRSLRAALERVGAPASAARKPPTAMRCWARTTPPAASTAPRSAPTICSRRTPSPASRWPAAAPAFSVANGGTGHSDLFQAGAYVRHTDGPAYISAALAYGWQDITTNRTVTVAGIDQLRAEFNANAWSGRVEGGYRFVAPWTAASASRPMPPAQFITFDLPAYAEQAIAGANTFALAYGAKNVTDPRSELGVRTDKSFASSRRHADAARPLRLGA